MQEERGITRRLEEGGERKEGGSKLKFSGKWGWGDRGGNEKGEED